jgi:hypothetical protein
MPGELGVLRISTCPKYCPENDACFETHQGGAYFEEHPVRRVFSSVKCPQIFILFYFHFSCDIGTQQIHVGVEIPRGVSVFEISQNLWKTDSVYNMPSRYTPSFFKPEA